MKFGVVYSFWGNEWKCDYFKTIKKIAGVGFDVVEIGADHLYYMDDKYIKELRELANKLNIIYSVNCGPDKKYDLASKEKSIRDNGIAYFKIIIENMNKLGSTKLVGAIYSFWPSDFKQIDKKGAWIRSIDSLKKIAVFAEQNNVICSLEVLNRNETYILTDCKEGLEYISKIGSKNIKLLLDTYHMNIEEDDMFDAIIKAGDNLGHVHVGENNRKLPGMNNTINWKDFAQALKKINYQGAIVMEPFLKDGGSVGNDIRVWRDLSDSADEEKMTHLLKESLVYLKKEFN